MAVTLNASTSTGLVQTADTSGDIALQNNGTTAVTVTGGNVGIGTTTPQQKLHINDSSSPRIKLTNATTGTGAADGSEISIFDADNSLRIINRESANILFGTSDTERMRIDSSGNVVMGNTSYDYSANGFGFGAGNAYSYFTRTSGFALGVNRKTTTGDLMAWWYNQSGVGTVSTNGSSTSYNTNSDYRLKENIAPMTGALAKVSQLKPVTYTWKSTGETSQGFIAHELAEIIPDCVNGEKDAVDESGNPVYQGIDTSFLVATLTAAIQEQQAMITEIKAELDATKAEVALLKGTA